MSPLARTLCEIALGVWAGAMVLTMLAVRVLFRRLGRADAWPLVRQLAPLADLVGIWAGTFATLALFFGRRGYTLGWAAALFCVAVMITAGLYDRAVLNPSLDAAFRRLDHGDDPKWEGEWRFLWRMAGWGRAVTLALAAAALAALRF